MILNLLEKVSRFTIEDSIREEALGDLWEADYVLESRGASFVWRELSSLWCFSLVVKASAFIWIERLRDVVSRRQPRWFSSSESSQEIEIGALNDETLETLRRYCDFYLHGETDQTYRSASSRRLRPIRWQANPLEKSKVDSKLLWLIQLANRVLEQCQSKTDRQGDSESVINSVLLSHFIHRLESDPPPVDLSTFAKLVGDVHLTREFIDRYVCFDLETFSRRLIVQTSSLSIYVISWEPGQKAPIHHHGYALDAIRVVQGEMAHWVIPPEAWEQEIPFEGRKSTELYAETPELYSAGEIALVNRRHAHQIANLSNSRLITLHFRMGHSPEDDHWRATADALTFVWENMEFVWKKPAEQSAER